MKSSKSRGAFHAQSYISKSKLAARLTMKSVKLFWDKADISPRMGGRWKLFEDKNSQFMLILSSDTLRGKTNVFINVLKNSITFYIQNVWLILG